MILPAGQKNHSQKKKMPSWCLRGYLKGVENVLTGLVQFGQAFP